MNRKSALLLILVIYMLHTFASPSMASTTGLDKYIAIPHSTSTLTFNPVADAYVDQSYPTVNYGSATQIRVDGSPIVNSYLRFNVSGVTGAVTQVTLRIYANSALSSGYNVHSVSDNTWSETAIDYSSAPAVGNLIGSSGAVTALTWTSVDVTKDVIGNGTYSFALTDPSSTALSLASRESSYAPELVITAGGSTPTPTVHPSSTATPHATTIATPTLATGVTPTATTTPTTDPVLVGAGDIAVYGQPGDEETAKLLDNIPGQVITMGDNSNDSGTAQQYADCYDPTWGRHKARTLPAVGNHDYLTSSGAPYFAYFGTAAHPNTAYYSYNLGTWHIIVLNSECSWVGGCSKGSAQEQWLQADLAAHPNLCTLAYWHEPRFSSGQWQNHDRYADFWTDLYAAHADLVLNGHDHDYERFAPQDPNQVANPKGIREFVVGTGGAGHTPFSTIQPNSQVRNNDTFGVIKFTLHAGSYNWQFIPVTGSTFTDAGSGNCN